MVTGTASGFGAGCSTSMVTISGAASTIAARPRAAASQSTTRIRRRCRAGEGARRPPAASTSSSSTSPSCCARNGRTDSSARSTRVATSSGMEAVHEQQAGDELVVDEALREGRRFLRRELDDPFEPAAVELGDQPQQLLCDRARRGLGRCRAARRGAARSGPRRPEGSAVAWAPPGSSGQLASVGSATWVGECSFFSVFPLPRYMWTPHGRHGSKLRTARMMSMPLKCSRSFSSKIGVFMTASS